MARRWGEEEEPIEGNANKEGEERRGVQEWWGEKEGVLGLLSLSPGQGMGTRVPPVSWLWEQTVDSRASPGHSLECLHMEGFSGASQNRWCQLGTQSLAAPRRQGEWWASSVAPWGRVIPSESLPGFGAIS